MTLTPPLAARIPTTRTHHGDEFIDELEWLRDKSSPEVIAHLEAENAYTEQVTADQQGLREAIFAEIKERTQETDLSVPSRRHGWWYFSRTAEGKQYPVFCRVPASGDDWTPPSVEDSTVTLPGEEVLLDCNAAAEGKPFFALGGMDVTRDGTLLAYAEDNAGDERFALRIKDLRTGELLPDEVENVFYGLTWSPAGDKVFYTVVDASWRPYQVKAHTLGTPASEDTVVFQEDEAGMWLGVEPSGDREELVISVSNSEFGETWSLNLTDPGAAPRLLVSRELRLLHSVDPAIVEGERHYFVTHNANAVNSMVSLVSPAQLGEGTDPASWPTVIAHRDDVKIEGTAVTATHLVVSLRKDTTPRVQVFGLDDLTSASEPAFDEELCTVTLTESEFEAPVIRLSYTSFCTPPRVYDYVLATGELLLRKQTPVKGGFRPEDYVATREWAPASDGTLIPLSIVRRVGVRPDGTAPCLVYGYGSYEASMDPGFAIPRLSLLDRGVVFVIAHVRGGGELGRRWYEDGKKLHKVNSFTDFVDATRHVIASGWADPGRVAAMGGSAGGLLMGAVLNLAPELYRACVAQVPFVDALTSILDPDLPLSALEWEEWGNPITDPEAYAYMKSYTPYENIRAVDYPTIAAVTSLNDTRVLYVEPAKWVQKLREVTTGRAPIVLKTEMDGGHGGASGRYEVWKDRAWDYAFLLSALDAQARLEA
ncbi:MAG: S9 family peptidase [Propionibacteriaceae bacterium]|nr:S9 family peptidase [Propionibacteriaceae bacterium]